MQTLTFNTTTKQVQLLEGERHNSKVLESFENVSTVKVHDAGFYITPPKNPQIFSLWDERWF